MIKTFSPLKVHHFFCLLPIRVKGHIPMLGPILAMDIPTIVGNNNNRIVIMMVTVSSLSADHLVTVVLLCQNSHGWFNNSTPQTKHQMQSRFW